jgi:hypothetical protein
LWLALTLGLLRFGWLVSFGGLRFRLGFLRFWGGGIGGSFL